MFYRNCGSGIGTNSHFCHLLGSDVVKYTARQLGTVRLQVRTLPSRLEMIGGGGVALIVHCSLILGFRAQTMLGGI